MSGFDQVRAALAERDAAALVHVGDRFDDDLRYLTRFSGPDRAYAVVVTPETSVLCAPALFHEQAEREFPGESVRTDHLDLHAGQRATTVLADHEVSAGATVLAPQSIPHDAALYLEDAGYELASTDAIERARVVKTEREVDRLRSAADAAQAGVRRAAAVLAESTVAGEAEPLQFDGAPLTTERLRREADAVMAREGVQPAANTVVGAGGTCADLHYRGTDPIHPGETVLIDVSPRGPEGYYADCTRTFVVDGGGGWERRAHVAVESAQRVALEEVEAGAAFGTVNAEAAAELGAYGFSVDSTETGFTHSVGHGIGVSLHEGPSTGDDLPAGAVVTIEPGVYDPAEGGVRIEDAVVVREGGYENLIDLPTTLDPTAY